MTTAASRGSAGGQQGSRGALSALDEAVLALIRARTPLLAVLHTLCSEIEKQNPALLCSILLLDADGVTLRHAAAPSLPEAYAQPINGVKIGPNAGSCGTAAYLKQQVIVSDIATDPLWSDYKHIALAYGLRACWSTPISSQDGTLLGTFAIYYREPCVPDALHLEIITHATHLAGIAIEHERTNLRLRDAEDRYRTLVERLPAITYVAELGADGPWHYVSPQIQSILGFSPDEWLSDAMSWMNHIHPEDQAVAMAAEKRFQETHHLFYAEYRMIARDGRILWFRDEAVMLHETKKHRLLMQGVLYNITEHKRMEEQLRHSQKMEAVGQLAGGVAHDFNNLLMLIQAHNEHLCSHLTQDDPARADSLEIERAVARAASLTRQLLAFSRKQILNAKVLDLNTVLTEVVRMLDRLIPTNIELKTVRSASLGLVKADAGQIEQIVLNLAVNARDAMPQGGCLSLETKNVDADESYVRIRETVPLGKYVMLTVSDTGTGMDRATQDRMFDPFFTTKEPGKGTGLGLATVYGVLQQMGGAIWVRSEPGNGTSFEIYLPQVEDGVTFEAAVPVPPPIPLASAPGGTETVFLVEDQDGIRDMVLECLERKGYTVLQAMNGQQALSVAAGYKFPIDLLITDVVMPKVGGRELARSLSESRPTMKILFISGFPEHMTLSGEVVDENAAVLQKPFLLDTLLRKVRSVLENSEGDRKSRNM